MTSRVCAVDVESTGLSPVRHVGWDYAIVTSTGEHQWYIKPDLKTADPYALRVGRYYERTAGLKPAGHRPAVPKWSKPEEAAAEIACLLDGATLLGHNVVFDRDFIAAFLLRHGQVLTADHHLIDTGPLVTGWIAGARHGLGAALRPDGGIPASADPATYFPAPKGQHLADLARAVGVDPMGFDQHTALGDARLAYATYRAVMGGAQ